MPYFTPGFNFTRGFWQWEFIRGKQTDKWRSSENIPKEMLEKYGNSNEILKRGNDRIALKYNAQYGVMDHKMFISDIGKYNYILRHIANTMDILSEKDTHTARVFRWAIESGNLKYVDF
jgi:hypothetical protein